VPLRPKGTVAASRTNEMVNFSHLLAATGKSK
jgi:hypothetical protein